MAKLFALLVISVSFLLATKSALADSVLLNEIMARPSDNTEWVELYNPTNQVIDLSGWKIKDGNSITSDDLTLSGQIDPLNFKTFDHAKGWLNDTGNETVSLLNGDTLIDSYQYNGATLGKTFGRQPDGESWQTNLTSTKNSSNGGPSPSPTPTPSPSPSPTISPTPSPTPTSTSIHTTTSKTTSSSTPKTSTSYSPPPPQQATTIPSPQTDTKLIAFQNSSNRLGIATQSVIATPSSESSQIQSQPKSFFEGETVRKLSIVCGTVIILGTILFYAKSKNLFTKRD